MSLSLSRSIRSLPLSHTHQAPSATSLLANHHSLILLLLLTPQASNLLGVKSFSMVLEVDRVIHARWIIPMHPTKDTVLEHHALVLQAGTIMAITPSEQVASQVTLSSLFSSCIICGVDRG